GLLLPQLGVALLNRSLFGTFSSWNVLCFMLCWNWCFLAGFINLAVGVGLPLVAAGPAPVIFLRLWAVGVAGGLVFALAIIVAHPFGGMFYFTLLIALAVGSRFEGFLSRRTLAHAVARAANRGWPVVLALAVIVIFGPKLPGSDEQGVIWQVWSLS